MKPISRASKPPPPLRPLPQSRRFLAALKRLPILDGGPIALQFLPGLTSSRGKLLSSAGHGKEVHAASFLRTRRITLESALLKAEAELTRILLHELFHFIWLRLGNRKRRQWEALLLAEFRRKARGDAGWSAEHVKLLIEQPGQSKLWRLYVCESFCDSGAVYAGRLTAHPEFTLAATFWAKRTEWLGIILGAERISI